MPHRTRTTRSLARARVAPRLARTFAIVVAALALVPAPGRAAKSKAAASKAAASATRTGLESLEKQVKEFTLANGLKFILVTRHEAPVFSFQTVVNSGSANDAVGTTGIAHMMEHMAFKGTPLIGVKDARAEQPLLSAEEATYARLQDERYKRGKADSTKLRDLDAQFAKAQEASRAQVVTNGFGAEIERNGGQGMNAFTSNDITAYFYSMPSNRFELWALLEGGRMAYPVFREFYKERDVVYEERRMRYESNPIGRLFWEFITTAFVAHPYGFGGIGYPSDLKSFSRTEGEAFYKRNYVAKNMCVALVGDVELAEAQKNAERYFSDIPSDPAPPPLDTVEPVQHAERRITLEDPAQPYVFVGWHIPAGGDPSYPAYEALASVLGGGDYSRLTKTLVKEKKIATTVQTFTGFPGQKYPNLFFMVIVPANGQDPAAVEKEAYQVMDEALASKPITQEELNGYKVRQRASRIGGAEDNSQLAGLLAQAQMLEGDWREFFRGAEREQALTPADLTRALKTSLVKSNRTVAMIVPVSTAAAAPEGGH